DELGIPVLVFSDWQETGLLGRAEWVKVVAALTGSEKLVNEKFELIEKEYKKLTSLTKDLDNPPKIICNLPYKGSWYVPGGNSYVSNLLHDAGSDYLWASDDGTGGIQMDFETVYAKGIEADFWINPDFAKTLQDIIDTDERLIDFKPISTRSVYNSNFRMSRGIANDFWESGIVNPHLILADLIKILHPELLPDHQLFYYKQIN
ncbi:MAG: ABC transporter substrate-binding protein, partial [Cyclobacteriaceae bacterium]|nr:ABC transporter substrate-binding protein [Cyclobacteriaceae bacterium]